TPMPRKTARTNPTATKQALARPRRSRKAADTRPPFDEFIDHAATFVITQVLRDSDLRSSTPEECGGLVRRGIGGFRPFLSDPETGERARLDELWASWDAYCAAEGI